ncbi:hypothetical protein K439DRAFT_980353 [Ramaria rubella]|nr:hypothetical protein K439DRAFT_980353 [Ramaria rubella]
MTAWVPDTQPNPALQPVSIVYSNDAPRYLDEPRLSLRPSYERSWLLSMPWNVNQLVIIPHT